MTSKLKLLQTELLANLSKHQDATSDASIARIGFSNAEQGLEELKKYPSQVSLKSAEDQELYHHTLYPLFVSAYRYLGRVCRALEIKSIYGRDIYVDFVLEELDRITKFLKFHLKYTQEALSESEDMPSAQSDNPSSRSKKKKSSPVSSSQQLQLAFNSPNLKANLDYKAFLEGEKKQLQAAPPSTYKAVYEFVGTQADAMEHIEGWTEMKVIKINGEYANLRQVAEMWANWFGKPISNVYSKKRINQNRKKDKAPFVTKMAQALREAAQRSKSKRI
ncbi:RteC domain-containing protein [Puia dinghuensis]|uniref:RteC protein n=1 Tax=Puia dinghuensis TaxID=1792502 RepID=A0A8J2UBC1_9BACT|nr:RteC domain-containing protein [Puia dinghuensis]GGA93034.1 hypothetical protein GCM10011511_15550 [Puia dinghuensis]